MQDRKVSIPQEKISPSHLSIEDRSRLVGAFVWLIEEDKKQNPALYQLKTTLRNDRHSMPLNTQREDDLSFGSI
jgi:hypothetical protein